MDRLLELLEEPRMSYKPMGDTNSLNGLYELILEYFNTDFEVAEIGSFEGASTELFALTCKKVYTIDRWIEYSEVALEIIDEAKKIFLKRIDKYENVVTIIKYSAEAFKDFSNESLDAVYIDGNHSSFSITQDLDLWYPKVKKGGYITGHDFFLTNIRNSLELKFLREPLKVYSDSSYIYRKE